MRGARAQNGGRNSFAAGRALPSGLIYAFTENRESRKVNAVPKKVDSGLVQAGQMPLFKTMVKQISAVTPAKEKLLNAAVEIRQGPDAFELAYMARELVQCTLPHSNPGEPPVWTRTNGNLTLVIVRTAFDTKRQVLVGYP